MGKNMEGKEWKPADLMTPEEREEERAAANERTRIILIRNAPVRKDTANSKPHYLVPEQPEPAPDPHNPQEEIYFAPPPKEGGKSKTPKTPHQESFEF